MRSPGKRRPDLSYPTKIRIVFTAYRPARGQYVAIPRGAMTAVVESFDELKRLFDEAWEVIEKGRWMKP
jgi:hypothetical protein